MKNIGYILFVCLFICMFSQSVTAMKRSLEDDRNQPFGSSQKVQKILPEEPKQLTFYFLQLPEDLQLLVVSKTTKIDKKNLRTASKKLYEICDKNKKWVFNKKNYSSFQKEMNNPWVVKLLEKLSGLYFYNDIELCELNDDELDDLEWNKKYVFISYEDLDYFKNKSCSLKYLHFYNVPFLGKSLQSPNTSSDLSVPFACSTRLECFGFDYNTSIFDASICSTMLYDCWKFINLKSMTVNSGIFFSGTYSVKRQIIDFFSPLTNLETLRLQNVEDDQGNEEYSTNLFKYLTCLKKLTNLDVSFTEKPELLPLTNLSSLKLTTLSLEYETETSETRSEKDGGSEIEINYLGILPLLLRSLTHLQSITFNNRGVGDSVLGMPEIISNNEVVRKKYPQLIEVKGNDVLPFDSDNDS